MNFIHLASLAVVTEQEASPSAWWSNGGGWVLLALVNAGLAEQKNRSRWTWFLISLILGPIATFLVVVWARAGTPPPPLNPLADIADRNLAFAGVISVLTTIALAFAVIERSWALAVVAAVGVGVVAGLVLLYRRVRAVDLRERERPGGPS